MDEVTVLVESFAPRPRMLVFGAIDFAGAVASIGRFLGYHVTVCDARARFATPARFPDADEVVVEWPHRYLAATTVDARTAICVLTHDPKFDVPVLQVALTTDAGYIGVMGSRRTHDDRLERLREAGVDEAEPRTAALADRARPRRAHPAGDRRVDRRRARDAAPRRQRCPLADTAGPIHHDRSDERTPART
jgi:xanthine/CO dehydrogenase XdhC/CoxF family maturation factor